MANFIVTNPTLIDICNFPSIRFGRSYVSRMANDIVEDGVISHPDPSLDENGYTVEETPDGATIVNKFIWNMSDVDGSNQIISTDIPSGIRSDPVPLVITTTSSSVRAPFTETSRGATLDSTFGGVASEVHAVITPAGATVYGKECD